MFIRLLKPDGTLIGAFRDGAKLRKKVNALIARGKTTCRAKGEIGEAEFNGKIRNSEDLVSALDTAGL